MAANVMLSILEKKATAVDLYLPLRFYIASAYSERDAATADDYLRAVRDLRAAAVGSPSLPDSSALEKRRAALLAYARVLFLVEPLISTSADRAEDPISFIWHDAFRATEKSSLPSVHLEKAAVLFNIGAVYSQIALAADPSTEVGIGTACEAFQRSAGAFAYLRKSGVAAKAVAAGATTVDVTPECAWMLERLMLAQAQECFFEKDIAGGKLPTLCSKIASQVSIYYQHVYEALTAPPLIQYLDSAWVAHFLLKEALFKAHAYYQFSVYLHHEAEIAQEIVCLEMGMNSLADAKKAVEGAAVSLLDSVNKLDFNMKTNLKVAIEENDRVYQMKIPMSCSLGELPAVSVVNSYSLAEVLDSSKENLFSSLVPDGRMKTFSELLQPRDLGSSLTSNNCLWAADLKKPAGSDTLTEAVKDDNLIGALCRDNQMCSLHLASSRPTSILDLPNDVFMLILDRISSPHDLERMRLVCWQLRKSIPSRLGPFLVISRIDATPLDSVCLLQFEPPNTEVGVVPMLRRATARILPPAGTVCWGSAHGLMAMGHCPPQESAPFLHCLHCGEGLPLPSFAPETIPRGIFFRAAPIHDHLVIATFPHADKGRLFNDTIDWDDIEAGTQWVMCGGFEGFGVTSVGFLPNLLMGVATTKGFLMVDEVIRAINNVDELIMVYIPDTGDKAGRPWTDNHSHIFVCEGKLYLCLLFDQYPDGAAEQDAHVHVQLYALANDNVEGYHLVPTKQIGPYSVFLGPNQAIVLPAFEHSIGRKPNTIYVEDWSSLLHSPRILAVELLTQTVTSIEYPTSLVEEGNIFMPAIWTCSPSEKVIFDHCFSQ